MAGPGNIPVMPNSPTTAPCGASIAPVGKMAAPNAPIVAPGDARSAPCLPNTGNPPLSLKAIELITDVMCRELGVGASKLALTGAASVAFPIVLSKQALTLPSCIVWMVPTLRRGNPSRTLRVHIPPERFKLHSHAGAWERSSLQTGAPSRKPPSHCTNSLSGIILMPSAD